MGNRNDLSFDSHILDAGRIQRAEEPVGFGRVEAAVLQHPPDHRADRVVATFSSCHQRVDGQFTSDTFREGLHAF
jgi:hypothetical protein